MRLPTAIQKRIKEKQRLEAEQAIMDAKLLILQAELLKINEQSKRERQ